MPRYLQHFQRFFNAVALLALASATTARAEYYHFADEDVRQRVVAAAPAPEPLDYAAPSPDWEGENLQQLNPYWLLQRADQLIAEDRLNEARQLAHFAGMARIGEMDTAARLYARAGDIQGALYWLEESARHEDARAAWIDDDPAFAQLVAHPRWPRTKAYMEQLLALWRDSGYRRITLVTPTGTDGTSPLPLAIGLHGKGDTPTDFVDRRFQAVADELGIAIVGVSGSIPHGPTSFEWTGDAERDFPVVDAATGIVSQIATLADGKRFTFGFSQGGVVAERLAILSPDKYAGALLMSPGSYFERTFDGYSAGTGHDSQGFIYTYGESESRYNVTRAKAGAKEAERLGARVQLIGYPNLAHRFPPDYRERWVEWARYILAAR